MRRIRGILTTIAAAMLIGNSTLNISVAQADTANDPSLTISQLKITSSNGQFITLHNTTDMTLDMSRYQLQYFNNYDLSKATSSRLIALSGTLPPHGYLMVNDSAMLLCYQLMVESVSLGLSSTAGLVQLVSFAQGSPGGPALPALEDYVGWSKTTAPGVQTLPANTSAFLQRTADGWQTVLPDSGDACVLVALSGGPAVETGPNLLADAAPPPVTIVSLADGAAATAASKSMPASDIGLMGPQINELLPNPAGTGNDSTDEYIELYNPNPVSFDLSGFALQTGATTTTRSYTFPPGTSLPAGSFTAFYSETTGLLLSNTKSQAKLLDPLGNSISASEAYASAKDGQSWALAKGKWYWTTTVTPNAANVIKQPMSKTSAKSSKKSADSANNHSGAQSSSLGSGDEAGTTPIHIKTLALVAGGALLYGAYEYRTDMGNKLNQLRRYFSARFKDRRPA